MTDPIIASQARVKALIEVTRSLNAIFAQENELLENAEPSEIASLQADKARLAAIYSRSIQDISTRRSNIAQTDQNLLAELREVTATFTERAAHQHALLLAADRTNNVSA